MDIREITSVNHFPKLSIHPNCNSVDRSNADVLKALRMSRAELVKEILDMPKPGGVLLNMIYNRPIPINQELKVTIDPKAFVENPARAKQEKLQIRRGLVILLQRSILFRTYADNVYWFNPKYLL